MYFRDTIEGETNIQGILHNENNKCFEEKRDTRDENIITHKEVDVGRVDTKNMIKNSVKCIETILNHWKNFTSQWEYFEFKDVCEFIMYLNENVEPSSVKTYINHFMVILSLNDVMLSKKEREIIKKIIKGISDDTIIVSKYKTTWSVEDAIEKLKTILVNEADYSSHIARKLAILILLKHSFRMHELHSIIRENVRIDGTTIKIIDFNENELRISTHYSLYCAKICPRKVINKGCSVKPLWIKDDDEEIRFVDIAKMVRSAVIFVEKEKKVPIEKILELGRWRNGDTLKTYYMKPITNM
uniref:Tyr recombinase domain-containing protein n=1 Tax=Strongyloides venezuelensis TaxID=75913 RepID=A0A0K0FSN3_STRVS